MPVKAKGLVRLRSPASFGSVGSESTPTLSVSFPFEALGAALGHLIEDVGELLTEEDRDDCGRRFVGAQAMIVGGGRDDRAQQPAPSMDRADHRRTEDQELRVGMRIIARIEQIALSRVAEREVDMLARSVDAGEGLFVQQADHAVLLGHPLQRDHHQLLMVGREVGILEHRRELELARRDLVVARLGRNSELEQLAFALEHEGEHPFGNRAEIMILELLAFRRRRAEQRSAGRQQIRPREKEMPVDQEIFLLGAGVRDHRSRILVTEKLQNALSLLVQRLQRAQQRGLLVERLAGP